MTKITSALAAALIASVSFASAALANEGDYFDGLSKAPAASMTVDGMNTGSIRQSADAPKAEVNSGDYFDGLNRSN